MREQLIQYVSLLFSGVQNAEDVKQEILQNTLDRYDDMVSQGKPPEAAYRLAISGIGDVNEILGTIPQSASGRSEPAGKSTSDSSSGKLLRAVAVGLYILSPIPLFILSEFGMETFGLCCTIVLVAIATVLIMLGGKKSAASSANSDVESARQPLRRSLGVLVWVTGIAVYFLVSFSTRAWFITWIIFPMTGAVQGIINACLDLKGGMT